MDKIEIIKVSIHNLLSYMLIALIIIFIIYRICFYLVIGQPLEMGNIPNTAPDIFRIVKRFLFYSFGISPIILLTYYIITWFNFKKNKLRKISYFYVFLVTLTYSLFWFFDFGSIWLYW